MSEQRQMLDANHLSNVEAPKTQTAPGEAAKHRPSVRCESALGLYAGSLLELSQAEATLQ